MSSETERNPGIGARKPKELDLPKNPSTVNLEEEVDELGSDSSFLFSSGGGDSNPTLEMSSGGSASITESGAETQARTERTAEHQELSRLYIADTGGARRAISYSTEVGPRSGSISTPTLSQDRSMRQNQSGMIIDRESPFSQSLGDFDQQYDGNAIGSEAHRSRTRHAWEE